MTPLLADYPLEECVALYAAGGLTDAEAVEFDRRRAEGRPEAELLLTEFTAVVADLTADVPAVAPPAHIRGTLLAALDPPPGYTFRRADDAKFRPTPHPGVSMRVLHLDRERRQFTCLIRFAPGARFPAHPHAVAEECVVLEGSLVVGGVRMSKGDYQRVEAGVDHADQWSDTGGLVYVTAPLDLMDHH